MIDLRFSHTQHGCRLHAEADDYLRLLAAAHEEIHEVAPDLERQIEESLDPLPLNFNAD